MWRTFLTKVMRSHGPEIIRAMVQKCHINNKHTTRKRRKRMSEKTPEHNQNKVSNFLRDDVGELSTMRLMMLIVVLMVFGLRIWGTILEGRYIPWDWPEVSLLTACFGGKALQSKYEGEYYDRYEPRQRQSYGRYDDADEAPPNQFSKGL